MTELNIVYWYWLVFGMVLIIAELFVPSFTIFWFGLGGLVVAVCLWLFPGLSLSWQLFIWAVASIGFTFAWFRYLRRFMPDRTRAGMALEAARGSTAMVIGVDPEGRRGTVRFATPLLGADEWPCIGKDKIGVGDRVYVEDISGNTVIVAVKDAIGGAK